MNSVFHILLACAVFAVCNAACGDCSCKNPETFTEDFFNSDIKPEGEENLQTLTFVKVDNVSVVNCVIKLECDFGAMTGYYFPNKVAITADNENSDTTNLNDVVCNGGKWLYNSKEVKTVGCYKAVDSP